MFARSDGYDMFDFGGDGDGDGDDDIVMSDCDSLPGSPQPPTATTMTTTTTTTMTSSGLGSFVGDNLHEKNLRGREANLRNLRLFLKGWNVSCEVTQDVGNRKRTIPLVTYR